jgi:hypothetical protein
MDSNTRRLSTLKFDTKLSKLKAKRKGISQIHCKKGHERSAYTKRCIKKCTKVRKNNQVIRKVRDPTTNRCRLPLELRADPRGRLNEIPEEGCERGWEKSQKTGRCVKKCFSDEDRNTTTGRCQKRKPNEEIRKRTVARRVKILERILEYDDRHKRYLNDLNLKKLLFGQGRLLEYKARTIQEYNDLVNDIENGIYDEQLRYIRQYLILGNRYLQRVAPPPVPVAVASDADYDFDFDFDNLHPLPPNADLNALLEDITTGRGSAEPVDNEDSADSTWLDAITTGAEPVNESGRGGRGSRGRRRGRTFAEPVADLDADLDAAIANLDALNAEPVNELTTGRRRRGSLPVAESVADTTGRGGRGRLITQDRMDAIMNNESLPPPVFGRESRAVSKRRRPDVGLETSLSLDPFLGARDFELTSDEINDIIENVKQGKSFDNNSEIGSVRAYAFDKNSERTPERTSENSYNLDD